MRSIAAPDPLLPTDAFQARVVAGRTLAERGDFLAAEAHFRGLLEEARDGHPGNHARALASLVTLYGRAGRYLEAHGLASRLATLARGHGPAGDAILAFALAKVCGALSQLHLTDELGPALAELRLVLDRTRPRMANLELEHHIAAGSWARNVGDVAQARRHVEAYRSTMEALPGAEAVYRWALIMADSRVLLLEGQPERARDELARLGQEVPSPAWSRLHELVLRVDVHAALAERERARGLAQEAVELLGTVVEAPFLAADFIHQGSLLTRTLEALGETDLAQRAYDRLAAAVLVNLRQVDDCMRALPELGLGDGASRAVLTRFRKQFLGEQRTLLARVARLLARHEGHGVKDLLTGADPAGFVSICAWCECVRTPEGAWLPIGHFIPRGESLHVTHGICRPCAAELTRVHVPQHGCR